MIVRVVEVAHILVVVATRMVVVAVASNAAKCKIKPLHFPISREINVKASNWPSLSLLWQI